MEPPALVGGHAFLGGAVPVEGGGKRGLHCSAGIHRTGMLGYALLRQLGLSAEAARSNTALVWCGSRGRN